MVNAAIKKLITYALERKLIYPEDRIYAANAVLEVLQLDDYQEPAEEFSNVQLAEVLDTLLNDACARGVCEDSVVYRDLFDTKIMGALTPRPSTVQRRFRSLYALEPKEATDWYYRFSIDTNYIRSDRVAKDMRWTTETEYGDIDISINLSKPEKDPKAIAAARNLPQAGYPKCQLCDTNEGYAGRVNHPARQNHRIIPIEINNSPWYMQYSPYVYYNEHCIVFNAQHTPMKIDRSAFRKLLDFVKHFPHYFVGSNADLPIVGGSILSHEHFQGGRYTFAMEKAPIETPISFAGYPDVTAGIVKWPMSVIRLTAKNDTQLVELADSILQAWRMYTDESAFIFAETDGERHNTITPIARRRGDGYELDLVLRNNITTDEHPLGVYHPHAELHHIKKENIGLIEVMGLAILPARLKDEMNELAEVIVNGGSIADNPDLVKHEAWVKEILTRCEVNSDNVEDVLKDEIGKVFAEVLEHAGVYKRTPEGKAAFMRFVRSVK